MSQRAPIFKPFPPFPPQTAGSPVKTTLKALPILFLLLACQTTYALDIIPANAHDYYQLGGGSDVTMPPVTDQQDITVGGDINTQLGFSCNGFNPAVSVSNTFNHMQDSLQGLGSDAGGKGVVGVVGGLG